MEWIAFSVFFTWTSTSRLPTWCFQPYIPVFLFHHHLSSPLFLINYWSSFRSQANGTFHWKPAASPEIPSIIPEMCSHSTYFLSYHIRYEACLFTCLSPPLDYELYKDGNHTHWTRTEIFFCESLWHPSSLLSLTFWGKNSPEWRG
jgi:hypothetical protein